MNTINSVTQCSICGFNYCLLSDVEEHAGFHSRKLDAEAKFGALLTYKERESIKREAWDKVNDQTKPLGSRIHAGIQILKCHFSRSIHESGFNLDHPPFELFVAELLTLRGWGKSMPRPVYEGIKKALL